MADEKRDTQAANLWTQILTDVHFWVPVLVLLVGLLVLRWMQ